MIIDCFPFFNELDLLEIRLNELKDVVDVFALSEATLTFTGRPKPLYFAENKERFEPFLDRIEHTIIDTYDGINIHKPGTMDWKQKQRGINAMVRKFNPVGDDIVILSDVDEIPKAERIKEAQKESWHVASMEMDWFYYFLNYKCSRKWLCPTCIRPDGKMMKLHRLRGSDNFNRYHKTIFKDAGWHFSWLGSAEDVLYKLNSYTHQEKNVYPYNDLEYIRGKRISGGDLFNDNRKRVFEFIYELDFLPRYVLDNMDRFERHIYYDN